MERVSKGAAAAPIRGKPAPSIRFPLRSNLLRMLTSELRIIGFKEEIKILDKEGLKELV